MRVDLEKQISCHALGPKAMRVDSKKQISCRALGPKAMRVGFEKMCRVRRIYYAWVKSEHSYSLPRELEDMREKFQLVWYEPRERKIVMRERI